MKNLSLLGMINFIQRTLPLNSDKQWFSLPSHLLPHHYNLLLVCGSVPVCGLVAATAALCLSIAKGGRSDRNADC